MTAQPTISAPLAANTHVAASLLRANAARPNSVAPGAARPEARALTAADLQPVESREVTNALYGAPGVRVHDLVWYWQLGTPTQIEEWVTLATDDTRIEIALDGDATGLAAQ